MAQENLKVKLKKLKKRVQNLENPQNLKKSSGVWVLKISQNTLKSVKLWKFDGKTAAKTMVKFDVIEKRRAVSRENVNNPWEKWPQIVEISKKVVGCECLKFRKIP